MVQNNQRQLDRQKVVESAERAIQQGMPSYLVEEYMSLARQYGQTYKISGLVEGWIKEGKTLFSSKEAARRWANSLD